MTLYDIYKIINKDVSGISNQKIKDIKMDSRKIKKGDLFIAIKGKNFDGNDFALEAIKKGALLCIMETQIDDDKCITVNDIEEFIFKLANYIRNKYNIPLIAVTGSSGKTTTKELIYSILKCKYNVLKNNGNENNIIGISNTLFKINNKHEIAVMELGSNHMGEISILSKMSNPTISIITNIGTSHIGNFKCKKNIFKEKNSVQDGMKRKILIVNGDDKYLKKIKCYKCGLGENNDLKAYNIEEDINKISFNIFLDKEYKIIFNNPGIHFINDILLAIKVCLDCEININTIINEIKKFKIIDKRMSIKKIKSNILINDCYNSSYESLKAGINYLRKINDRKIIILGDILELGRYSRKLHKKVNKHLKDIKQKEVFTVGNYTKYIKGMHFNDNKELIDYLKHYPINNCYIYVKGSRKTNLDEIINYFCNN